MINRQKKWEGKTLLWLTTTPSPTKTTTTTMITFNSNYIFPHSSSLAFICSGINTFWHEFWLRERVIISSHVCTRMRALCCVCVISVRAHDKCAQFASAFFAIFLRVFFLSLTIRNWGYNRLRPNEIQHQLNEEEEKITLYVRTFVQYSLSNARKHSKWASKNEPSQQKKIAIETKIMSQKSAHLPNHR